MELTPCKTLYINNLNEKIRKEVAKKTLYALFSQFGRILEIVACRGKKLRGQAWITFQDVGAATNALRRMQGFNFYDKPLRIAFAKEPSDIVAKKDGTFHLKEKRKRERPTPSTEESEERTDKPAKTAKLIENDVPHNILFAQALPDDCTEHVLSMIFQQQCPGFKEVRMISGRQGIAFVEFQDEVQAGLALSQLNGFAVSATEKLHLTYANKE